MTVYAPPPTLAGFQGFIVNTMGISNTVLPPTDDVVTNAYNAALEVVSLDINTASPLMYTYAVYNLAGDNLINWAQDQTDAPNIPGSDPPAPFFQNLRATWNILGFVSGVVQAAGDEGTNTSLVVQKAAENFTLGDLQNLKTPYGRVYLSIAQKYGPSIVGLT